MTGKQTQHRRFWTPANLRLLAWAALAATSSGHAGAIELATQPQSTGGNQPAPNIFLTVDDSGSMSLSPLGEGEPATGEQSRMYYLKKALTDIFLDPNVVPDNSIRLGFQALNQCRSFSDNPYKWDRHPTCPDNRLRRFSGNHRNNFRTWVGNLEAGSGTRSHAALFYVDDYMKKASAASDKWNPFLPNPGYSDAGDKLSCRRTYHIFMTDGAWKDHDENANEALPGNADGTLRILPDGTRYDPYGTTAPQTNIYRDLYEPQVKWEQRKSTLSDWAFMMWARDYSGLPNNITPIIRKKEPEHYGQVAVSPYWNPRNNPMTWQGITTYTIGFGPVARLPSEGEFRPYWGGDPLRGGDVNGLFDGTVTWSNPLDVSDKGDPEGPHTVPKRLELWHMGLNGRGQFVPANNGPLLVSAFKNIINQVFQDNTDYIARSVPNTQSIRSDSLGLISSFNPKNWSGDLLGYGITSSGELGATPQWSAARSLDGTAAANRLILSFNKDTNQVVSFDWSLMGNTLQNYFKASGSVQDGKDRIAFIRGDRTKEDDTLRSRHSVLGDIVNSSPWIVSAPNMGYADDDYIKFRRANLNRREMAYVGANDGMLHGFIASDVAGGSAGGREKFAYIPRGSFIGANNGIISLTNPGYSHRFFVDGSPFSGDYRVSANGAWKTVLIGSMGLGGRGFFAIDITTPGSFDVNNPSAAAAKVLFDKTDTFTPSDPVGDLPAATWADLGHLVTPAAKATGNPNRITQITKLNNNRWAVLLGNGVNSGTEKASLLIQFLDHDRELVKIEADSTVGGANGLSTPTAVDLNGDRKADVVYAGDLKGQVWKFDLSSNMPSNWGVAFSGHPMFVAKSTDGTAQPIMTAPSYLDNEAGGLNLVFGTGRNITQADPSDTTGQTVYSVWDNTDAVITRTASGSTLSLQNGTKVASGSQGGRSSLLQREVDQIKKDASHPSRGSFVTTDGTTGPNYNGTGTKQRGWYFDLPATGERAQDNSTVVIKSLVYVPSMQPTTRATAAEETCDYQVKTAYYGLLLDGVTGLPYRQRPLFDTNQDDQFAAESDFGRASRIYMGADPSMLFNTKGRPGEQRFVFVPSRPGGNTEDVVCNTDNCGGLVKAGGEKGRVEFGILNNSVGIGWRQLQ